VIPFFTKSPWSSEVRDNSTISFHRVQLRATYAIHVGTYMLTLHEPYEWDGLLPRLVRTKYSNVLLHRVHNEKDLVAPGPNGNEAARKRQQAESDVRTTTDATRTLTAQPSCVEAQRARPINPLRVSYGSTSTVSLRSFCFAVAVVNHHLSSVHPKAAPW